MCDHRCLDKDSCKHACCKWDEEVAKEKMTGAICYERAAGRDVGDPRKSLIWARRGIDDHVSQQCLKLLYPLHHGGVRLSDEERRVLIESDEASGAFFSGYCLRGGRFGFSEDETAAYRRFCVAAEKHHVYGIHWMGLCLRYGIGVAKDAAAALQCLERAVHLGCVEACYGAGDMLRDGEGVARDKHRAALFYRQGATLGDTYSADCLLSLMRDNPKELAPWSRWKPESDVHSLQLQNVHRAQMTMLMVAKRVESLRPVRLMILRYISTRTKRRRTVHIIDMTAGNPPSSPLTGGVKDTRTLTHTLKMVN